MSQNYALTYESTIAEGFSKDSYVKPNTSNRLNFVGAKTVRMYQLVTVEENDYQRSGSNRLASPKMSMMLFWSTLWSAISRLPVLSIRAR